MTTTRVPLSAALGSETRERAGSSMLQRFGWPAVAVVVTILIASTRLVATPRFYFADDTERGSFGQWWQLGEYLSRWQLPVLDPSAWQAGNYFAEGQWGVLSPVTWLIGITAYHAENPVLHATVVKIAALAVFALGMHLLAREFGAARPWAALVAVMAPAAGFTVYMDAASWSTGLFNAAVLPFVWWGLRRAVERGRSPVAFLIASFTLITIGYVFGVIVLVLLLVETLVRHLVRRDWKRALRTVVASGWGALWTLVVYLPGVLTAAISERGNQPFANYEFLNADLADLASSASPWLTATVHAWWGEVTAGPLVYITWALPLLAMLLPLPRATAARLAPVLIVGALMLAAVLAPSHLGALRWPVRMMPYLVIAVLVLFAVAATKAFPARVTRRGAASSLALIVAAGYISYVNEMVAWRSILVIAGLQAIAVLVLLWLSRRRPAQLAARATALVAAGAMVATIGFAVVQLDQFPRSPLPSVQAPDDTEALESVLPDAHGDGIVAGDGEQGWESPDSWDERLMANLWYLSPTPMSSLYTVLPYTTYANDLCSDLRGVTCDEVLDTLWEIDGTTGERVSDLLSISTILVMKETFPELPELPEGWSVVDEGEYTWLLERDEVLPAAGGVAWTGDGTSVTTSESSDTAITFTVDAVGSDARVTLSRLEFPGYSVQGADFADPVRDYLLTVDLTGIEAGSEVTVRFLPPPFPVLLGSAVLALLLAAVWIVVRRVARRRRR